MPRMVGKQMKAKLLCVSWRGTGSGIQTSRPWKAQGFAAWRTTYPSSLVQYELWNYPKTTEPSAEWPQEAACAWRGQEHTVTWAILRRPQGPIQSFKNTSGKNSPALNPACSTSKQVKAPQNAQSWWSLQLLRLKVFPPEHHKWDKLHNRIIRVVAERCNHKIKGLFKIWGWLVLIQERNIKESNSKVPASSCYRDTVMAKCQRVLSATTDLPLSSSAAALFLLLA